jgi:hypothetical protein
MNIRCATPVSLSSVGQSMRRNSWFAAIPMGVAVCVIGAAPVAADEPNAQSGGKAAGTTTVTGFAEIPEFPTTATGTAAHSAPTRTAATGEARDADGTSTRNGAEHRRADAKARKDGEEESEALANVQSGVVVASDQQICKSTPMTGTRLRKQVCISAAQQEANNRYQERQAQDYLRMLSEQALRAPARPSPYISVNPGF